MICPRDKVQLIRREIDGYHFHFCDHCHGVWFSKSGLQKYISDRNRPQIIKTGQEPWETHDPKNLPGVCPVDGSTPMVLGIKYGVYVDICHEHKGIWLDSGELEKIIEGIRRTLDSRGFPLDIGGQVAGELSTQGSGEGLFHAASEVPVEMVPEVADAVFGAIAEIVESLFR